MEPMEATLFRVTVDWLDFGIDIFQLVIHLSKGKQMAFRLSAILWCPAAPAVLYEPLEPSFLRVEAVRNNQKLLVSATAAPALEVKHDHEKGRMQAHAFQVWWLFLLMVVWWGQTYCAPNSFELAPAVLCPLGLTWLPSRQGNNARHLGTMELNPCNLVFFLSPTSPPLVPYLMRSSLPR